MLSLLLLLCMAQSDLPGHSYRHSHTQRVISYIIWPINYQIPLSPWAPSQQVDLLPLQPPLTSPHPASATLFSNCICTCFYGAKAVEPQSMPLPMPKPGPRPRSGAGPGHHQDNPTSTGHPVQLSVCHSRGCIEGRGWEGSIRSSLVLGLV